MCDYSLETMQSRPAVKGEKLVTRRFGSTSGLCSRGREDVAVCLLPGTELALAQDIRVRGLCIGSGDVPVNGSTPKGLKSVRTARFTQINKGNAWVHHDALEFPGTVGCEPVMLNHLANDQEMTVLQVGCTQVLPDSVILELREGPQVPDSSQDPLRLEHQS